MGRHWAGRVLIALLFVAGLIAIVPGSGSAGTVAPRLSTIAAIFVAPDTNQPLTAQCNGQQALSDPQSFWTALNRVRSCTTYYAVDVPLSIGQDIKVRWSLIGKKCGSFSKHPIDSVTTTESDIFFTGWFHPHPDNKPSVKPCNDLYPHPGRTIKVTVKSHDWTCTAKYPEAALGTQLPDLTGHEGPEPKPCTPHKRVAPA